MLVRFYFTSTYAPKSIRGGEVEGVFRGENQPYALFASPAVLFGWFGVLGQGVPRLVSFFLLELTDS